MTSRVACGLLACALVAPAVQAAPMAFKGGVIVMADLAPDMKEVAGNYALTARDAFGARAIRMRADDGGHTVDGVEANYTRLIARWNLPEAQANAWFVGGLGTVRGDDFGGTRTLATPGLQVDYETARVYLVGAYRLFRASGVRDDVATARAGFSFYAVDYDQLQPWLVVEARRVKSLSDRVEITPLLRLVQNRVVFEAGVDTRRRWRANVLYTF